MEMKESTVRVLNNRVEFTDALIGRINALAEREGWAIFNDKQIQRDDEAGTLACDADAVAHVRRLAEAGSFLHAAALDIHEFHGESQVPGKWHLFYIEAEANPLPFASTLKGYLVSSLAESRPAAERMARAAVRDALLEADADPVGVGVESCSYVGIVDRDVWKEVGELRP
jgi:hypothetical protein